MRGVYFHDLNDYCVMRLTKFDWHQRASIVLFIIRGQLFVSPDKPLTAEIQPRSMADQEVTT